MKQANAHFMGDDPGTSTANGAPFNSPGAGTSVDLRPVSFGTTTFTNPCFWVLVGIVGTIAVQYFLSHRNR